MPDEKIKYSPNVDISAAIIEDAIPERMVEVFPYELINTEESVMFMAENAVSIAAISQKNFEESEFHNMEKNKDGVHYFKMFASIIQDAVMDIGSATSTYGTELKIETSFTAITNQFIDHQNFKPIIATVGKPFDKEKYEAGEQYVYIVSSIVPSDDYTITDVKEATKVIDTETLTEFKLLNITNLETRYRSARILFTENEKLKKEITSFDGASGMSIGIEAHTLLHAIKGKGKTIEFDKNGKQIGEEFGEIDLISKEKWAPFKFTPSSVREKLTMYADWFDYDTVLPFVYIEKFKSGGSLSDPNFIGTFQTQRDFVASGIKPAHDEWRKVIEDEHTGLIVNAFQKYDTSLGFWVDDPSKTEADIPAIGNKDDLRMVEDMIAVSAGFASNWDSAPVFTSGDQAGKIKPDFRVGHAGIKVSVIAGKDPIKVIDGIYENHIRRHPTFETDLERYQSTKAILNALSRYLYSSYAIGKGQNSYNMAYLPWYLEPYASTPVEFDKQIEIPNPDKGATGKVKTFVLNDNVKFQAKSIYFHGKFSADISIKGQSDLIIPNNINFSNQKLVQTDRKLTIPELPDNISPINKMPLPGDINTRSSEDLKYLFYIPIQDQTRFEEFMLNKLTAHTAVGVGTDVVIQLPRGVDGMVWTQQEADAAVIAKQPGTLKTPPIISSVDSDRKSYHAGSDSAPSGAGITNRDVMSDADAALYVARIMKYRDASSVKIISNHSGTIYYKYRRGTGTGHRTYRNMVWTVSHSEFTPATITTTSASGTTYSFQGRQVIFDKQEWKDFLVKFNMVPDGFTRYTFDEKPNWKIDELDELVIQSVWGNEIEIFFGTGPNDYIKVPLFNKDDETISTQRILFT